jgi:hypothetical protein
MLGEITVSSRVQIIGRKRASLEAECGISVGIVTQISNTGSVKVTLAVWNKNVTVSVNSVRLLDDKEWWYDTSTIHRQMREAGCHAPRKELIQTCTCQGRKSQRVS